MPWTITLSEATYQRLLAEMRRCGLQSLEALLEALVTELEPADLAADQQVQAELRQIAAEFALTERDGLSAL